MKRIISKLIELRDAVWDEIKEMGGIHIALLFLLFVIISLPFIIIYFLIIYPVVLSIHMLFDVKEFGWKTSYKKNFHSEKYEEELMKKEREKMEALEEQLPTGRQKSFKDWKTWPEAKVVDRLAVYSPDGYTLLYVDENVEEFDVPEGVVNIYHRCFEDCNQLRRVSLPSTLKRIGKRAFCSCASLKEISIPESVYTIEEEAFMYCSSLEHITLPPEIIEIPPRLFSHCRSLQSISLPAYVRTIYSEAFRRCYSLEQIKTNNRLEIIYDKAFEDCRSLKEFIMPETVEKCTVGMFNGCHSLQHIHFSSQINDFGGSCCYECWNIGQITMTPMSEDKRVWIKEHWEKYAEKVDITTSECPYPDSMFWTMEESLFFGIPRLTSVCLVFCFTKKTEYAIPSFVTNVKRDAFTSCKNLCSLHLSPYIKTSSDPWESNKISYGFIYEYWPQVKNIIFDEGLKHTEYAFGLIG